MPPKDRKKPGHGGGGGGGGGGSGGPPSPPVLWPPLVASPGAFTMAGQDAYFTTTAKRALRVSAGQFTLTGQPVQFAITRHPTLVATPGTFVLTGTPISIRKGARQVLLAHPVAFTLTGQPVGIFARRRYTLTAGTGTFTLAANAAGLVKNTARQLACVTGQFTLSGKAATITARRRYAMTAGTGSFSSTGAQIQMRHTRHYKLVATVRTFTLTGNPVNLTVSSAPPSVTVGWTPPPPKPANPTGIAILPGQSIQGAVNQYPVGTTFILKAGVHQNQAVIPKSGQSFYGENGTIMNGGGTIQYAFNTPASPTSGVRIQGIEITNYNPPIQMGAVRGGGHTGAEGTTGWVVAWCNIHHNLTGGGLRLGHQMQVLNNTIHHNAQLGIGGTGTGILCQGNDISYNNWLFQYNPGFEAGGTKFSSSTDLVVRSNWCHHNGGPGLWTDINNYNTRYEYNTVEGNAREGIVHEVSFSAVINNNLVIGNGTGDPFRGQGWLWNAGIGIHASQDVEVHANTVKDNRNGIALIQQDRSQAAGESYAPPGEGFIVQNVWVHDNAVDETLYGTTGAVQDVGSLAIFTRNNRFTNNSYTLGTNGCPFEWMNGCRSLAQWQAYGNQ
jgi:hypothetical protein